MLYNKNARINFKTMQNRTELINPQYVLSEAGIIEGLIVADLGCGGPGYFVLQAAKMVGKNGLVYAVDIQKDVLKNVESKAKINGLFNVKIVWSDLEVYGAAKDIADASLDVGCLINTVHQTKNLEAVFKETNRIIKPGGKLLFIEWNLTGAPFGPAVNTRVPAERIEDVAEASGFAKEKEFKAGKYHYGIVFIKQSR